MDEIKQRPAYLKPEDKKSFDPSPPSVSVSSLLSHEAFSEMATVVSIRSLHGVPTLSSHSPAHGDRTSPSHHYLLPSSPGPRSLRLKTLVLLPFPSFPFSPSRLHNSTSLFASAAASYSGDEDEDVEQFEDEQQDDDEEEHVWNTSKASTRAVFPRQQVGRLYVGNLPFTMTPAQLAEVFSEAGTVETVEVRFSSISSPAVVAARSLGVALTLHFMWRSHQVVYDRVTERSRGFAFVTMASVEEANEAIRMFDGSVSHPSLLNLLHAFFLVIDLNVNVVSWLDDNAASGWPDGEGELPRGAKGRGKGSAGAQDEIPWLCRQPLQSLCWEPRMESHLAGPPGCILLPARPVGC